LQYTLLGRTGIRVSRFCFGTLTMGPLQARLPVKAGAALLVEAASRGVNFIDSAELYRTYTYIREMLKKVPREGLVIASRSYAYTYEGMEESLRRALKEIGTGWIDIFLLHEQESRMTLKGHREALRFLLDAKARGLVRAVGISTHYVEAVVAASEMDEIDVIHPLINMKGIGLRGGTVGEMEEAIALANERGKGIYSMKALGGGNLLSQIQEAFQFVLDNPNIHSIAVGVKSREELEVDLRIFEGLEVPEGTFERTRRYKSLLIESWCSGCGTCVERCRYGALQVVKGRARVDPSKCILCGYCGASCPQVCIKVV